MPAPGIQNVGNVPATCSVKGLLAFGPGTQKGELYSPERSGRVPDNFKRLPGTIPLVKIGHDKQQRFAQSLGFPNVGRVTACEPVEGYPGHWTVDADGIPTEVGGEINAGRLCGSSVELNKQRLPEDQSITLEPVLTGISFLGEEQPAVRNFPAELRDRAKPIATFADGSRVPPNRDPSRWLNAMADVTKAMAAEYGGEFIPERPALRLCGHEYAASVACFSDFNPGNAMTPELQAALDAAKCTPEMMAKIAAIIAEGGGGAAPVVEEPAGALPAEMAGSNEIRGKNQDAQIRAMNVKDPEDHDNDYSAAFAATCKKYADDPAATPDQKMMAAMFSEMGSMKKKFAETTSRLGSMEAAKEEDQKKTEVAKMSAFSDRFDQVYNTADKLRRPSPAEWAALKAAKLEYVATKSFSALAVPARDKVFSDLAAQFAAMPVNPLRTDIIEDHRRDGELTPFQKLIVNSDSMKKHAPLARAKLLEPVGTAN